MCIACPSPKGLLGWSENRKPPAAPSCKTGGAAPKYYKIAGVQHFSSPYDEGQGPMKVTDCRDKCSKDCKCAGFFYREESSKCFSVPVLDDLRTLPVFITPVSVQLNRTVPRVHFYNYPFRLCFYNTTPDAHILALRAGIPNDQDLMRWVWDANRNDPVRDGPYSIVIDKKGFTMYLRNSGEFLKCGGWRGEGLLNITFDAVPEYRSITSYELTLAFSEQPNTRTRHLLQSGPVGNSIGIILKKLNYNATYSFLRLESDGNLKAFTYYTNTSYFKWDQFYAFFGDSVWECGLLSKCGSFGLCDNRMCIACPSPKGLLGWSESCKPPAVPSCANGVAAAAEYYKIAGVQHFSSPFGEGQGPMKVNDCRDKCSKDCKCVGFFYREESSKCLSVPVLGNEHSLIPSFPVIKSNKLNVTSQLA
ncbi:hypothetical protein C5167_046618 [Papaver somniferum]|uniref:Apple domain-containing protein n=1 Tax=Papaver somniferum TaxID=3469 RepID=A0A4Y7LHZ8_PAPSO|nr:hypothetical protein C5167_046618 [Papaver somniferum]